MERSELNRLTWAHVRIGFRKCQITYVCVSVCVWIVTVITTLTVESSNEHVYSGSFMPIGEQKRVRMYVYKCLRESAKAIKCVCLCACVYVSVTLGWLGRRSEHKTTAHARPMNKWICPHGWFSLYQCIICWRFCKSYPRLELCRLIWEARFTGDR